LIILNILILIFCSSCVSLEKAHLDLKLSHLDKIVEISTNFIPAKSVYSSLDNTTYIMEKDANRIHIYKDDQKINSIGGMGFDVYNFNKLTDIALSPDGNLLALDSFARKIKTFDREGKLVTQFNLELIGKPEIFDISLDETFYIYDRNKKEIVITRITDEDVSESFGKFILSEPVSLIINDNMVQVYDRQADKTFQFDLWGDLLNEWKGNILQYKGQTFKLEKNSLLKLPENRKLELNIYPWSSFLIKQDLLLMNSDQQVRISEFVYEI